MLINVGKYEDMDANDALREVLDVFIEFNIRTNDDKRKVLRVWRVNYDRFI